MHPSLDLFRPRRYARGSLKNVSSNPASSVKPDFLCPHSGTMLHCIRLSIMGESGIRKDPDALTCVESSPTLTGGFNLIKVRRHHA